MMRRTILALIFIAATVTTLMAAPVKPKPQRVYMFGMACSFTDSTVVMTDLQAVDAYVMPNGFLADRSLYTLQLNNHLVAKQMREHMTCTVFYDKNKVKAEKKYQKIRNSYRSRKAVTLQPLGVDEFRFEPEEWVDSEIIETSPEPSDSIKTAPKK